MIYREEKSGAAPWTAFLMGAIVVVVAMVGYLIYAGQGYQALRTAQLNAAPPSISQPNIPDLPIDLPKGEIR